VAHGIAQVASFGAAIPVSPNCGSCRSCWTEEQRLGGVHNVLKDAREEQQTEPFSAKPTDGGGSRCFRACKHNGIVLNSHLTFSTPCALLRLLSASVVLLFLAAAAV